MSAPALQIENLRRNFGALTVANNISFALPRGARYALIGPNGAGKTTLVNLITGRLRSSAGKVLLDGDEITTLSQAAGFAPHWRAGFGYEFMERPDGYRGLAAAYGLHFAEAPRVMDLGLLARALKDHQIDFAAGNATDGLILALDLFVLEDDRHYFPPYDAVPVIREEVLRQHPEITDVIAQLAGKISDREMQRLNFAVDGQHRDAKEVAHEFLKNSGLSQ